MFEVVIKGFETKAQAEFFLSWFGNQGEQDLSEMVSQIGEEEGLGNTTSILMAPLKTGYIGNQIIVEVEVGHD